MVGAVTAAVVVSTYALIDCCVANMVAELLAILSSSLTSEMFAVVGKSMFLEFMSKSPPSCGVASFTKSVEPASAPL